MFDYKMDPALKADWVKALRSGDFKQGEGELRLNDCYCCLGVLCKIGGADETVGRTYNTHKGEQVSYDYTYQGKGYDCYLPEGFAGGMPANIQQYLADKNDAGEPFDLIADYIEENL